MDIVLFVSPGIKSATYFILTETKNDLNCLSCKKKMDKMINTRFAKFYKVLFLLTFLSVLFVTGCSDVKLPALGAEDEIIVVADSADYLQLQESLSAVFCKIIKTPQNEQLYNLKRINYEKLSFYKQRKNLIIISPLNSETEISKYLKSILDAKVAEKVNAGEEFVFNKYDLWARNQIVMIMASPDIESLNRNILKEQENLLYYVQNLSNKRIAESLYNDQYEKKDIEGKFLKNYGWMIYVQADYLLAKEVPEDNFVWLRRSPGTDMERWLFVHWIENASPNLLHPDSVFAIRDKITKKYYRTMDDTTYVMSVDMDDYKFVSEVNFLGRYALMTNALWKMSDNTMGGPFINYTFYDEKTHRIYMLDGSIFAPKFEKKKLIQQMDVTLQSFLTESEVPAERKEDLFDSMND